MLLSRVLFPTDLAVVWRLSSVPHDVVHKVLFSGETFLANVASVRSFTRMFSNMIHHVFLPGEGFRAVLTPVRRFAGVAARMVVQVFLSGKALATDRAVIGLVGGVTLHVTLQRGRVCEHVEADRTGEHRTTQVTFAVPRQIVGSRKGFPTDLASEGLSFGVIPNFSSIYQSS